MHPELPRCQRSVHMDSALAMLTFGPSEIQRGPLHFNATMADAIGVESMPSTTSSALT